MSSRGRYLKWVAVGLAALLASLLVVSALLYVLVLPAVISRQLQARTGSYASVGGFWINTRSAGLTGVKLHSGPSASSPEWAAIPRVSTDLTLGGVLRGRFSPGRVTLSAPVVSLAIDREGKLKSQPAFRSGGSSSGPIPVVIAEGATVRVKQEDRPEMVLHRVTARLGPDGDSALLSVRSSDPEWGVFEAHGHFAPGFKTGRIDVKSVGPVSASPAKLKAIPFVPADVWRNVAPTGDLNVRLAVVLGGSGSAPVSVKTEIDFLGATVRSDSLDLTVEQTTGRVVVDGGLVKIEGARGRAIEGRIGAGGALDFTQTPPRFDVGLDLDRVNVADAPKSWQLEEAGMTGRLSGKVRLLALLRPEGVDLSGSSGDAVVEDGEVGGIPFKSIRLLMKASGSDLRYDTATGTEKKASADSLRPGAGLARLLALTQLVALQAADPEKAPEAAKAPEPAKAKEAGKPAGSGLRFPRSISTQIDVEDADLSQLVQRAQVMLGYPFPLPITGRISVKAAATIPLGKLHEVKGYAFHGDLLLTRASVFKVDLGRVSTRVDLADGVLDLKDLRGRLVDRPDGGPDNPPKPEPEDDVPATGPLPPGGFRGDLHAAISPPGRLTARFESHRLPLGELAAPVLPRPTPLSGEATISVDASADLNAATDPAAWTVSASVQSRQIRYKGATLDAFSARGGLKGGRLDVAELNALLGGRPLSASGGVDLKPPRAFRGSVDVTGWQIAEVLAWVPGAPSRAPVSGAVTARADAEGTAEPFALRSQGRGRFDALRAGPVALGELPFEWATKGDAVFIAVKDARPFGGRVTAEARVPLTPGRPIEGAASLSAVDAAALSASIPGDSLKLTGKASGTVSFSVPADASAVEADVKLSAPDLTVQGVPVEQLSASVRARGGSVGYTVSAESLGGKIRFAGAVPLGPTALPAEADGELRAAGFTLDRVWRVLGRGGALARIAGEAAVDANLRARLAGEGAGLYAHGVAEARNLRWGDAVPLGRVRGVLAATPTVWRIDPITGDVLGGELKGFLWGSTPAAGPAGVDGAGPSASRRQIGFSLQLDHAPLQNALALLAARGPGVSGYGSLRAAGTLGEGLNATADLHVPRTRVAGIPVTDLRLPAEIATNAGHGSIRVRRWSARLAGGHVRGDASFRLGSNRSFQTEFVLSEVDLESIARIESDARRPASGKISGRVTVSGPDPALPQRYRGRVSLDLDDASVVALPVFREIDKFLGAARGGLFEDGDLTGTIANRQLVVDSLTLEGRLVQIHATGNVGFDGQLNLEVLVNTNQIISQTGQSLVAAIPGLSGLIGRNREARLQVANYLSNRLLKLRVTGTVKNPSVALDAGVGVGDTAVGFFSSVLKLPLGLVK